VGCTYVPDRDNADPEPGAPLTVNGRIQCQFLIVRPLGHDRYVVQLFEWVVGDPTTVIVLSEAELLGTTIKLYLDREAWVDAYIRETRRRWDREREQTNVVMAPFGRFWPEGYRCFEGDKG
jgi:hypothetical protein